MIVGIGVVVQYALGLSISSGGLYYLRDLHASIGTLGLILMAYLFYSSIRIQGSASLKVSSFLAFLVTLSQVVLGFHIYFSPSILLTNIHTILGGVLIALIAITGYLSIRSSRARRS